MSGSRQLMSSDVVASLKSNWVNNCGNMAACVLVLYDHLTTLSQEVEFIWGRQFSSVTLLYHLNRWTIFVWAVNGFIPGLATLSSRILRHSAPPRCIGMEIFGEANDILLAIVWMAFSAIRMFAISGGNWWFAIASFLLTSVTVGTNAYYSFATTSFEVEVFPVLGPQCVIGTKLSDSITFKFEVATRVCMIAADTLILVVTWSKTYVMKRDAIRHNIAVPLATTLLADGTTYFIMLLSLNVMSIVGYATNVFPDVSELFTTPLLSIIISHFLLNLRQVAGGPRFDEMDMSRPSFVTPLADEATSSRPNNGRLASFIDNMGEQLNRGSPTSDSDISWAIGNNENADIERGANVPCSRGAEHDVPATRSSDVA